MARGTGRHRPAGRHPRRALLAETRFLVEAVVAEQRRLRPALPERRLGKQVGWVLDLMPCGWTERPLSGGVR